MTFLQTGIRLSELATLKLENVDFENRLLTVRQGKGDHEIWCSPHSKTTFSVDGKIVSRHSANGVLKDAGLPKAF